MRPGGNQAAEEKKVAILGAAEEGKGAEAVIEEKRLVGNVVGYKNYNEFVSDVEKPAGLTKAKLKSKINASSTDDKETIKLYLRTNGYLLCTLLESFEIIQGKKAEDHLVNQLADMLVKDFAASLVKFSRKGTLLHVCIAKGNDYFYDKTVKALEDLPKEKKIQFLNAKDENGNTALHIAAEMNNSGKLLELLELGADHKRLNDGGKSVSDLITNDQVKGKFEEAIQKQVAREGCYSWVSRFIFGEAVPSDNQKKFADNAGGKRILNKDEILARLAEEDGQPEFVKMVNTGNGKAAGTVMV